MKKRMEGKIFLRAKLKTWLFLLVSVLKDYRDSQTLGRLSFVST